MLDQVCPMTQLVLWGGPLCGGKLVESHLSLRGLNQLRAYSQILMSDLVSSFE